MQGNAERKPVRNCNTGHTTEAHDLNQSTVKQSIQFGSKSNENLWKLMFINALSSVWLTLSCYAKNKKERIKVSTDVQNW